jgi:hypothetical protein
MSGSLRTAAYLSNQFKPVASGGGLKNAQDMEDLIATVLAQSAYNVCLAGAVGDGVADDTAGINAALAAHSNVYFPAGTYKISGLLNVTLDGSRLSGAGRQATKIISNSTTASVFATGSFLTGVVIEHMTIDRSVTPTSTAHGIVDLISSEFTRFSDLVVQNHWVGLALGPTGYSVVNNVVAQNNYSHGFYLTNTAAAGGLQWSFSNCLGMQNNGVGFLIASVASGPTAIALGEFHTCATFANTGGGFSAAGVSGCPIYGVRIHNGFFGQDGSHEVLLDTYGGDHEISCFTELAGQGTTGRALGTAASNLGAGFRFTGNNLDVNCTRCYAEGHAQSGFLSSATEAQFVGCKSISNGVALIAGDRAGFSILAGRAMLNGIRAGNLGGTTSQSYGVQFTSVLSGSLICGADLVGNTTQSMNIIAGIANLTTVGVVPDGNILLPLGGISTGSPTGGATLGGINVAVKVALNNTSYTNP